MTSRRREGLEEGTVFVVDDNPALRKSLQALGESSGLAVEAYDSGDAFLAAYDPERPGCLVLDLRLREQSGLDLQDALRKRAPHLPIIIMTGHGTVQASVRALKAGAVDFLLKPVAPRALLRQIREALRLDRERLEAGKRRAEVVRRLERLTPRERQVMDLLVDGKTSKEIAWELHLSVRTVEGHRRLVLRKMKVSSAVDLVRAVLAARAPAP